MPSPGSSVPEPRAATEPRAAADPQATAVTYRISGMTCDHCVRAVRAELRALPGVLEVTVALDPGAATVTSSEPLTLTAVRSAVEEAGYTLV
jgi:copper chaperone CopZ